MQAVDIIVAPFHAGARNRRVGAGPLRLLEAGLLDTLQNAGADVCSIKEIPSVETFEGEIGRSFEVIRRIAAQVAISKSQGRFPVVLAGNCNASVGVYAGLGGACKQVVWFDAHADFDTPDECTSGYFDGMGMAILSGQCWRSLAATIPGFRPLDLAKVVYCGIRDFEPGQREKVEAFKVRAVFGSSTQNVRFDQELRSLISPSAQGALVHVDLDCLDTSVGQANEYAAPGGLAVADLIACLDEVVARTKPMALTIASFSPGLAGSDAIAAAGVRVVSRVVQAIQQATRR